jgi:hypothetical protein
MKIENRDQQALVEGLRESVWAKSDEARSKANEKIKAASQKYVSTPLKDAFWKWLFIPVVTGWLCGWFAISSFVWIKSGFVRR